MGFIFVCPFCNQRLDCDDSLQNQVVACPLCNSEIVPQKNQFEGKIKIAPKPLPEVANSDSSSFTEIPAEQNKQTQIIINNYGGSSQPGSSSPPIIGNANAPKQRVIYILLGFFLGGYGVHNFYAGYKNEACIQLVVGLIGLFIVLGGFQGGFLLNMCVGIWALANIICRKKDASGRPMV